MRMQKEPHERGSPKRHARAAPVLTIAGKGELDARAERGEYPHAQSLHHLPAFVVGRVLPKKICKVHRALDHKQVQGEAGILRHERFGPATERLFVGVKGSQVLWDRQVAYTKCAAPRS